MIGGVPRAFIVEVSSNSALPEGFAGRIQERRADGIALEFRLSGDLVNLWDERASNQWYQISLLYY